jgi:hypothetical protein
MASGAGGGLCGDGWLGVEWLYWTTTGHRLPPFLVASAAGQVRTVVGDRIYNDDWRNGVRVYGGLWIGALHRIGFEGDYFYLGKSVFRDAIASDGSAGTPVLARPYFQTVQRNANGTFTSVAPFQTAQFVAVPGFLSGSLTTDMVSEFSGATANMVWNCGCDPCAPYRFTLGYRYLNLTDTLFIRNDLLTLAQSANPGTQFRLDERFRVENHFSGVPIGVVCERGNGSCFLSVKAAVSLGVTRSVVDIAGSTLIVNAAGDAQQGTGALLALPSNIGTFTRDTFAVVPEATVRAGWQHGCARLYVGYNFIYWSSVVRAGGVIDRRVNTSQQPNNGPVTPPLFPLRRATTTDFFSHGAMIGLHFSF